jgi:hypothetical protein
MITLFAFESHFLNEAQPHEWGHLYALRKVLLLALTDQEKDYYLN